MNKPPDHFSDDATAITPPSTPKRLRYPCAAHQCPMPGTMFLGGRDEGVCGWHARENPADWSRITQAIHDWECVVRTINRCRRVMTDPATCADAKAQDAAKADAWATMQPAVAGSGWKNRVAPGERENLGDWGRRLEGFLGARVKGRIEGSVADETKPTPVVATMHAALRDGPPKGNAADGWAGE